MASSSYERVPSAPVSRSPSPEFQQSSSGSKPPVDEEKRQLYIAQLREQEQALAQDPRFDRQAPSAWKRVALLAFVALMFWIAIRMRMSMIPDKPEVIYASRFVSSRFLFIPFASCLPLSYSKEHKYRPAASPIITKTLADGRVRIHGANPTHVHMQQRPRA